MPQSISTSCAASEMPMRLSLARKSVLLLMFCFAQFLDAFNNAALFPAMPTLATSMGIEKSQLAWIVSGFQLTFASFLLISGRISDVYNPRSVFITGVAFLGILSLCAGFVNNKIAIIVLRTLMGIASAMSIPSALALLVHVFPQPTEQARAIAILGSFGAIADVLGLFLGAVLVQYASYHWVFWFAAIVAIPVSISCLFIIPTQVGKSGKNESTTRVAKWQNLDLIGILTLTIAFILFVYAVTTGSGAGWASAKTLVSLVLSLLFALGFFYWETLIPSDRAVIPPSTWFYNNFSVLFGSALLPFFWWNAVFFAFTTLWQNDFHWTIISTVIHMLPIGTAALVTGFTGPLSRVFSPKWIILTGLSMVSVASMLVAVGGGRPDDYWPYVFPAFTLGSAGIMLVYTHTNIAIFQVTPASMAGTIGAIFNGALQFGSALGLAAFISIETSMESAYGGAREYHGRAAAFWFLFAVVLVELLSLSYFYRTGTDPAPESKMDDCDIPNIAQPMILGENCGKTDSAKQNTMVVTEGLVFRLSLGGPNHTSGEPI